LKERGKSLISRTKKPIALEGRKNCNSRRKKPVTLEGGRTAAVVERERESKLFNF